METGAVRSYYVAALRGLGFVEQRQPSGRRFGEEADALWSSFQGDLQVADRIDLLIRDADAQWPGAFGARTVFERTAVAEDEPFGADWEPLDAVDAAQLWRSRGAAPCTVAEALAGAAEAWGLRLGEQALAAPAAADKLVVAGPRAIAALVQAFAGRSELDWADQVLVVASVPAHRQLAALAGALLNATKPTRFAAADSKPSLGRLLVSEDAWPQDAARAQELCRA